VVVTTSVLAENLQPCILAPLLRRIQQNCKLLPRFPFDPNATRISFPPASPLSRNLSPTPPAPPPPSTAGAPPHAGSTRPAASVPRISSYTRIYSPRTYITCRRWTIAVRLLIPPMRPPQNTQPLPRDRNTHVLPRPPPHDSGSVPATVTHVVRLRPPIPGGYGSVIVARANPRIHRDRPPPRVHLKAQRIVMRMSARLAPVIDQQVQAPPRAAP
jgi:hypothetical protein